MTRIPDPAEFVARDESQIGQVAARFQTTKPPTASFPSVAVGITIRAAARRTPPKEFDHTNADRLFYRTDRFEAPFADNMSAWLRKGDLDRSGHLVKKDRFIADNVRLTFTETHLVVHSHNLPNHPTAVFPDRWRALDGNPNYIREQNYTWFIPLEPRENPDHVAMQAGNANRALPGGPIGIAVNGVMFLQSVRCRQRRGDLAAGPLLRPSEPRL